MIFSCLLGSLIKVCTWLVLCFSIWRTISCYYVWEKLRKKRFFLWVDVLGRNCIVDVFAGGVLLRLLAAASTVFLTLSRGDCLSWRKTLSGIRGCRSIWGAIGGVRATSLSLSALGNSGASDGEKTAGYRVNCGLGVAIKETGSFLLVVIDAVNGATAGIGVKTLEGAGRKLRKSSRLRVPSLSLCVSATSWVD